VLDRFMYIFFFKNGVLNNFKDEKKWHVHRYIA